ncbi:MAG: zf-HC2 domain-containing protein, partial [Cyanobacteria bacterium P01_D01_bin.71]
MSQHRDLDATKRDRFELLSAYLDGEVSPDERRLVATWLDKDPEAQCLYRRLLQLRQGFQGLSHMSWQ